MRTTWILLAALGMSAGTVAAEPPEAMFPDAGVWGVGVDRPYPTEALRAIGVQWVRANLHWADIETGARGRYDWAATDKLLGPYLDGGFHVVILLTMEKLCPLYEADMDNQEVMFEAIARWAGAAAARFKGKGLLWEIGNERGFAPLNGRWTQASTYTILARRMAAAVKVSDPKAKVAALCVGWLDQGFVVEALKDGLLADGTIDVLTYHGRHHNAPRPMPRSSLAEQMAWLRGEIARHAPENVHVIVADSARCYSLVPFLSPEAWHSPDNRTYSESEQAAYLARHYLATISLGVEICVWPKVVSGGNFMSLYCETEEEPRDLRPMGHVYRNLAALLPDSPTRLQNDRYAVSLVDLPDKQSAPDGSLSVRTFLRTYLRDGQDSRRLIVALWNPIEAFDGRILDNRKRIGDDYYEAWRAISPDDPVTVPTRVQVADLAPERVAAMATYDLLSNTTDGAWQPLEMETAEGRVRSPVVEVGPMPTVLVFDIRP